MDLNDIKNLASSEKISELTDKASALKNKVEDVAHTVAEKAEQVGKSVNVDCVKSVAGKVGEKAKKLADAIDYIPGAATGVADDEKVDPSLVKQETRMLNNNPRNTDM